MNRYRRACGVPRSAAAWRWPFSRLLSGLFILLQDRSNRATWTVAPSDTHWTIQAGARESSRLVLRPATSSIGLALHPIETEAFGLQARVTFSTTGSSAGLIVQADDANHSSAFLISSDGYFRLSDFRNGIWIDRVAWRGEGLHLFRQ